jgi:hypothetical protein
MPTYRVRSKHFGEILVPAKDAEAARAYAEPRYGALEAVELAPEWNRSGLDAK